MSLASPEGSGAHQQDTNDHLPWLWGCGESQCHRSASWHSGSLCQPSRCSRGTQSLRYWLAWFCCLLATHSARAGWGAGWDRWESLDLGVGGSRWWGRRKSKCRAVHSQDCCSIVWMPSHLIPWKRPCFTDKYWPRELTDLPQTTSSDSHQTTCCLKDRSVGRIWESVWNYS